LYLALSITRHNPYAEPGIRDIFTHSQPIKRRTIAAGEK